jgi:hypothetical protein
MTQPSSYRGIPYTVTKGPNTAERRGLFWHSTIAFADSAEQISNLETKSELLQRIERAIDIHLDYGGDADLYYMVENLLRSVQHYVTGTAIEDRIKGVGPKIATTREMRSVIGQVCECAQKIISTRYADSDRAALIEKLRAMNPPVREHDSEPELSAPLEPAGAL